MIHSRLERRRIDREARAKLGLLKPKASDYSDFMDQCVADMTDAGMSEDEAEDECNLIWENEENV